MSNHKFLDVKTGKMVEQVTVKIPYELAVKAFRELATKKKEAEPCETRTTKQTKRSKNG